MDSIKDTITPAAPAIPDLPQQAVCATSALMRQADATRSAYFADVRRGIALSAGEVQS